VTPARVLRLDQIVEGTGAIVEVRPGADGSALDARLAMDDMPRIEPLLLGRPVAEVPGIVERICGICPAAHHLAGVRALEALAGVLSLTPTADAVRRLLHHGAVLQTHAQSLTSADAVHARVLNGFAHAVVAAAGGDSHFPRCAVPGGVLSPLPVARRDELAGQVGSALELMFGLLSQLEVRPGREASTYGGHDLALVNQVGALDLFGDQLRAVAADGSVTVDGAGSQDWADLVAEARPGSPASRPYLRALGPGPGAYRVGPVAQLRAARCLGTPLAEEARQRWSLATGDAAWARAVVTLHALEVIDELIGRPELVVGPVLAQLEPHRSAAGREASGWVDGARGLLVHTYRTDGAGLLSGATITTPTAQNETWLGELLHSALRGGRLDDLGSRSPGHLRAPLEAAIREAGPCLPCTSTPPGQMHVRLHLRDSNEAEVANWLLEGARWTGSGALAAGRDAR
jgi:NAD-reducing hydrogenase large subunit